MIVDVSTGHEVRSLTGERLLDTGSATITGGPAPKTGPDRPLGSGHSALPESPSPSRFSHLDCRVALTLIVALHQRRPVGRARTLQRPAALACGRYTAQPLPRARSTGTQAIASAPLPVRDLEEGQGAPRLSRRGRAPVLLGAVPPDRQDGGSAPDAAHGRGVLPRPGGRHAPAPGRPASLQHRSGASTRATSCRHRVEPRAATRTRRGDRPGDRHRAARAGASAHAPGRGVAHFARHPASRP